MRARVAGALLGVYARVARSGLLDRPLPRRAFESAYLAYKRTIEAGPVAGLRAAIPAGSTVIDVGANIGFFSLQFGRWVGPAGRVVAVEPEARNAAGLRRRVERAGLESVVECVEAAAADRPGELMLELNPLHPGDHHIADTGEPVRAVTVDELAANDPRPIALLKIDVQGAEMLVLAGAETVIARHRPAIFVEVDDTALGRLGSSASELIATINDLGYRGHSLTRRGIGPAQSAGELTAKAAGSYIDVLFLAD